MIMCLNTDYTSPLYAGERHQHFTSAKARLWRRCALILSLLGFSFFIQHTQANIAPNIQDPELNQLLEQARKYVPLNHDKSVELSNAALSLAEKKNALRAKVFAHIITARAFEKTDDDNNALQRYQVAFDLCVKNDNMHLNDPELLYYLGDAQRLSNKLNLGIEFLKKGMVLKADDKNYLMQAYERSSNFYRMQEDYINSIETGNRALELAKELESEEYTLLALKRIAYAHKKRDDHSRSLHYNKEALAIAKKSGDKSNIALFQEYVSADQRTLGQYVLALKNARSALEVQRELNDTYRISNLLLNISIINLRLTRYDQALAHALELIPLSEAHGDINRQASTFNQVGLIYGRLNQLEDAISFHKKALALNENKVDIKYRASAYRSLANIYKKLKKFDEAVNYANQARSTYLSTSDLRGVESVERVFAQIYKSQKKFDKAIMHHERALKIAITLEDKWSEATSRINIGAYLIDTDPEKARTYLTQGLKIANKVKSKSLKLDAYRSLISLERKHGNSTRALNYYDTAYELSKEIDNKDINKRIAELKVIHETEQLERDFEDLKRNKLITELDLKRKNAEVETLNALNTITSLKLEQEKSRKIIFITLTLLIGLALSFMFMRNKFLQNQQAILKERNSEAEKSNQNLKELNQTKNRFFSIISHDLRSPITTIVGLSDCLKEDLEEDIEKINFTEVREHINAIHQASDKTFDLLENLLSWATLQLRNTDPLPKQHQLNKIYNQTISHLEISANLKEVELKNSINEDDTIYADGNMIATVLRNLLSNAIKFTPHGGQIHIYSESTPSTTTIHVHDSGVGMDQTEQTEAFEFDNMNSRVGTDGESGTGFGLSLCQDLIAKNHGHLEVNSISGRGSDFYFTLPRSAKA